jgi:2-dehydro-3-deoxyphosphogluconate aldolase/(4S)-4-hydroxy-2-oxoglutarate aldolase
MMPNTAFRRPAFKSRVVPVIVLEDAALAVPMAEALLAGGVDVMEITLRHASALASIEAVAKAVPLMHIGAGTVTRPSDVQRVIDAGAQFALSPGCTEALADTVIASKLPFIPGVMTPGEVMAARDWGFTLMKLFPAAQAGGIAMLQALASPFADVSFCPTGGVNSQTLASFLKLKNVAMVGGSWLTPPEAVRARDWAQITALAREATSAAEATA